MAIRNPCSAMRRPAPERPERCGFPRRLSAPRNDSRGRWLVPFRRGAAVIVGVYCGTVDARFLHWVSLFVGDGVLDVPPAPLGAGCRKSEIFGGPSGRPAPTIFFGGVGAIHESPADAERHRNIPRHCEEPQGDVAIPWYKGRPENRRDCHVGLRPPRNDVHILGHPL